MRNFRFRGKQTITKRLKKTANPLEQRQCGDCSRECLQYLTRSNLNGVDAIKMCHFSVFYSQANFSSFVRDHCRRNFLPLPLPLHLHSHKRYHSGSFWQSATANASRLSFVGLPTSPTGWVGCEVDLPALLSINCQQL